MMLLVLVFGVSASFASDADDSVQATDESADTVSVTNTQNTTLTDSRSDELPDNLGATNEESYSSSNNDVLTANPDGSFTDLANLVKNGGTVTLDRNYVYTESKDSSYIYGVNITKPITIDGRNFKLDGNHLARIFYINSNDVTLKNINFVNGYLENGNMAYHPNYKSYVPSMVEVWGDNLKIDNCVFKDSNVSSSSNAAGALGGDGANALITNSKFYNNYARVGSALTWGHSDQPDVGKNARVVNCIFENNTCFVGYGAINNHANAFTIENCIFKNNTAKNGPAGAVRYYSAGADCKIINSKFINNKASGNGGALTAEGTNCLIENCEFVNNNAGNGGAIYWPGTNGVMENCEFNNNSATSQGGAFHWSGTYGTLDNCNFTNNKAASYGVGYINSYAKVSKCNFINNNGTTSYGALSINTYSTVNNCLFDGNECPSNSALYMCGYTTVSNSTFKNNVVRNGFGGAIHIINGQGQTVDNCTFINNSATSYKGGAIHITSSYVTIKDSTFEDNKAAANGGAINAEGTYLTVNNCEFNNNQADGLGGAIYSNKEGVEITDSTFNKNTATSNSGALSVTATSAYITGNTYKTSSDKINSTITTNLENRAFYISSTGKGTGKSTSDLANWTYAYSHIANGGTIYFTQGTYTDIVNQAVTKSLNLIGLGTVTIDLQQKGRAFSISAPYVTVDNIDFKNGKISGSSGAIAWSGAYGTLTNSNFDNNYATGQGGCIYWSGYYGTITNNNFNNNRADSVGGGSGIAIYLTGQHTLIDHCNFKNNTCPVYGNDAGEGTIGLYSSYCNVTNCYFEGNSAGNDGIVMIVVGSYNNLINDTFYKNHDIECPLDARGMVSLYSGTQNSVINCKFINNTADHGGGLNIQSATYSKVINCTFINNTALVSGGGLYTAGGSYTTVVDSTFEGNDAPTGGAIGWNGGIGTIDNITVTKNTAENGSAIYLGVGKTLEISNSTFENNIASNEGTVYVGNRTQLTIENSDFNSNDVQNGGDIKTVDIITSDLFFIRQGATGTGLIESDPTNWDYAINHIKDNGKIIFFPGTYSDLINLSKNRLKKVIL